MNVIKINVFNKTAEMLIYWTGVLKFLFSLILSCLTMQYSG